LALHEADSVALYALHQIAVFFGNKPDQSKLCGMCLCAREPHAPSARVFQQTWQATHAQVNIWTSNIIL
jgi:hypothetical protein